MLTAMSSRQRFLSLLLMAAAGVHAQSPATPIEPNASARRANSDTAYLALRGALPAGDGITVKDFTLEREGGVFHFEQGEFYFYGPVNGRVTGAVFSGKGHFELAVTDPSEKRSLALLTKSGVMQQDFTSVVLRFTDGTADEIRKASTGAGGGAVRTADSTAADLAKGFRRRIHENLELRLLQDVLSAQPGGFFLASFRMGGAFTGRNVLFMVDPEGTLHATPDEVELSTWSDESVETWAAYRMKHAGKDHGLRVRVTGEKLDVTFERSGKMTSSAETTVEMRKDGVRVVPLNLFPTLRVSGVFSESGAPLDFVQEAQDGDPDFAVILPQTMKAGDEVRILTKYAGPDALRRDGNDIYYLLPGARDTWYPSGQAQMGDFANFNMTFHVPKGLQIVATGKQISHDSDGSKGDRVVWATDAPIPVAGFNLGNFKTSGAKTPAGFAVDAYANVNLPDAVAPLAEMGSLGTMSTVTALKGEVSQGNVAIQIYSDFFGKLPYDHVALTQQSACNFGQSWPMLVYLPICAFWDETVQHQLGLLDFDRSYWTEVTPHEVSHQWWGNLVGFNSYRDQWMSEGFANFSVGIFLLNTQPKMDQYRAFWNEQRDNLLKKNTNGMRPVDVGPLTMGARVSNEKSGEDVYQMLIYSKGAYILHMLEMMYWTPEGKEEAFKQSMHQFVTQYTGKAATTEDLKTSFEHTMPKSLDLRGDGKLDWFFDEYVYGTELPHYTITSEFSVAAGVTSVHMKLAQSNVSKNFVMLVPIYLQMENGSTVRIANIAMHGEGTIDHVFTLGKLPSAGKKLLVNYNSDVLSD
jgi:Peptidase family M1 domain